MSRRNLLDSALAVTILALSLEILARRWLLGQRPTPLAAPWVYGLLAGNAALLAWSVAPLVRRCRSLQARATGLVEKKG